MILAKRWDELSDDEVIDIHINCYNIAELKDFLVMSSIRRMEAEAHRAVSYENSRIFLPAMACFSILDQIGKTYCRLDMPKYPEGGKMVSGIKKAAYYFLGCEANDLKTKTLYAFRNAVMHEASFANSDKNGNHYWFRIHKEVDEAVKVAANKWDGEPGSQTDSNCSRINPKILVEVTSKALSDLASYLEKGTLKMDHPEGVEGIKANYLLRLPYSQEGVLSN